MLKKSDIKKLISESGMRIGKDAMDKLIEKLEEIVKEEVMVAIEKAKRDKRKTIMVKDIVDEEGERVAFKK